MDNNHVDPSSSSLRGTYSVEQVAEILGIPKLSAYDFCSKTKEFRVLKIGRSVRVAKESFDKWFSGETAG